MVEVQYNPSPKVPFVFRPLMLLHMCLFVESPGQEDVPRCI